MLTRFTHQCLRMRNVRPMVRFHHNDTENVQLHCWKCGKPQSSASAVLCGDCRTIQPVSPTVDYYDLLVDDKGHGFDVNPKALKFKFLTLQQKAHPDSYSQATKQEHDYAQMQSSTLNKAYNTLKDPLARAKYLLEHQGMEVGESDSLDDPVLLMEVMEIREELDEATTEQEVQQVKQLNDEKYNETVEKLSNAFASNDFTLAKKYMIQLQYWESIRRAILEWSP